MLHTQCSRSFHVNLNLKVIISLLWESLYIVSVISAIWKKLAACHSQFRMSDCLQGKVLISKNLCCLIRTELKYSVDLFRVFTLRQTKPSAKCSRKCLGVELLPECVRKPVCQFALVHLLTTSSCIISVCGKLDFAGTGYDSISVQNNLLEFVQFSIWSTSVD